LFDGDDTWQETNAVTLDKVGFGVCVDFSDQGTPSIAFSELIENGIEFGTLRRVAVPKDKEHGGSGTQDTINALFVGMDYAIDWHVLLTFCVDLSRSTASMSSFDLARRISVDYADLIMARLDWNYTGRTLAIDLRESGVY
jgi:hypothetical protein